MKELHFEWDPSKAEANIAKHGISFEEAASVFYDGRAVEFYDDENSNWEDRFLLLGISSAHGVPLPPSRRIHHSSYFCTEGNQERVQLLPRGETMKDEYDLSKMKSRPNPYARKLKKQVTLRIQPEVIDYFKAMAEETGIPYQSLINLYLQDCVNSHRKLNMQWAS